MTPNEPVGERISALKAKRDAINAEIGLIEKGMEKAAYDACMQEQYLRFNEARLREGKRQLTASEYASGVLMDGEPS